MDGREKSAGDPLVAETGPDGPIELYDNQGAPVIYADGIAAVIVGPVVTKLLLYTARPRTKDRDSKAPEHQDLVAQIVLPTHAALNGIFKIIASAQQNAAIVTEGTKAISERLPLAIAGLSRALGPAKT